MTTDSQNCQPGRSADLSRYSRQMLFEFIGQPGQRKLLASRVLLIGCGALGSVSANLLARAGVGLLRIADRDYIEMNNLQRQDLFDEQDIAANLPKAEAARQKLQRINSDISIEAKITDVNPRNIEHLADGVDLLLDGTDNFETRFLINDLAVKTKRPWVYGACVGTTGLSMPIVPDETPCLRCVFEQAPPPEMNPTCDTAGILAPIVNIIASHQVMEAIKILIGRTEALNRRLIKFDLWTGRIHQLDVQKTYDLGDCPCCKQRRFDYLDGKFASSTTTLCGRDAVQVLPTAETSIDLAVIAEKIESSARAKPQFNQFMLKASVDMYDITLFPDGRAIIKGTNKPDQARTIYAKYIGA